MADDAASSSPGTGPTASGAAGSTSGTRPTASGAAGATPGTRPTASGAAGATSGTRPTASAGGGPNVAPAPTGGYGGRDMPQAYVQAPPVEETRAYVQMPVEIYGDEETRRRLRQHVEEINALLMDRMQHYGQPQGDPAPFPRVRETPPAHGVSQQTMRMQGSNTRADYRPDLNQGDGEGDESLGSFEHVEDV